MSLFNVQQSDISLLFQKAKECYVRLELLNSQFQPIEFLEGEAINGGLTISADSDLRRTCNITLAVKNKSYLISETSKIWFDKLVRLSFGVKSLKIMEIIWYNNGIFLFNQNSYSYDATNNTLSVQCTDEMSLLNGVRGGTIGTLASTIKAGVKIRDAMVDTITQLGGVTRYRIENISGGESVYENELSVASDVVPYDLKFSSGSTVYHMVSELRDLYPGWETFFDTDGTFLCQKTPTKFEEPFTLNADTMNRLKISESSNISFEQVKNVTEVWGKVIEADRFADAYTLNNNVYQLTLSNFEAYTGGKIIGIKITGSNPASPQIKVNELTAYPIVDANGKALEAGIFKDNSFTFKYMNQKFYYLGQFQVHALAMEYAKQPTADQKAAHVEQYGTENITYCVNPDSPFGVDRIGPILNVVNDTMIYSDGLAIQRARYENWMTTRWNDSMSLQMVAVPWLDVNQKIEYQSSTTGEIGQYIVKSISTPMNTGVSQVQMIRYYPLYPDEL